MYTYADMGALVLNHTHVGRRACPAVLGARYAVPVTEAPVMTTATKPPKPA